MIRRFPIGLTLATAIAFAILVGLGVWQVKRLAWKEGLLAHIAALKTAPAVPIGPVLTKLKAGQDVEWTRVEATCASAPGAATPNALRYALRDGKIIWRATTACRLPEGAPFGVVTVDRGYVEATAGQMSATTAELPQPVKVVGVFRVIPEVVEARRKAQEAAQVKPGSEPPDVTLVAEHEDPAPPGVTPSALPEKISNNHLSYALTWFGLAATLLAVYAAMLFRRLKTA